MFAPTVEIGWGVSTAAMFAIKKQAFSIPKGLVPNPMEQHSRTGYNIYVGNVSIIAIINRR